MSPTRKITDMATSTPRIRTRAVPPSTSVPPQSRKYSPAACDATAVITPAKIATPPSRGIGVLCTLRPPGVSTSPLAMRDAPHDRGHDEGHQRADRHDEQVVKQAHALATLSCRGTTPASARISAESGSG